jgi:hypothetical protein
LIFYFEGEMHNSPDAPAPAVAQPEAYNFIVNLAAIVCGIGLVALICWATSGLDLSSGFF